MNDDTPAASELATEIHRNFLRKMAPKGAIDRILNGGEPVEKRLPESDEEIALRKKQIEIQLREYAEAMTNAEKFQAEWKSKQPKGFRRTRRTK